jgi:putative MATE family efflux protein
MERQKRLAEENVKSLLLSFSIPAIIGMLVSALYNIVDRIFIGNIEGIGQYAITGVGLTFPISTVVMAFSMLVGIGTAATISIRLGQHKKEEAEKTLGNAFILTIINAIILTVIGLLFADKLLYAFGASKNTFQYAKQYINIILIGNIFNMLAFSMNHSIRAEGNPRRAASTMLIGAVLNTILDPIFIFVFGWGVQGAAWATILSQMVSAIWVLNYFLKGSSSLKLRIKNFKIDKQIVLNIFSIGMSPFAMQLAASVVSIVSNKALKVHGGDLSIGAMTVIGSVTMIFLMPIFGINQGAQPIIGFNYGAKSFNRVKDALRYAIMAASSFVIIGFIVVQAFPVFIIKLFNDDAQLVNIGIKGLRIYLCMLPAVGFQIVSTNYFQSIGKAKISMLLSMLRQVILLIPLFLILPNILGLNGVWLAGPIADGTSSIITGIFLYRELRRLRVAHENSEIPQQVIANEA